MSTETMVIKNTRPKMLDIGAGPKHAAIKLKPGANEVPVEDWQAARSNKVVQSLIAAGDIEEGKRLDTSGFGKLKPGEAIKLARDTYDREKLAAWLVLDLQPLVRQAVEQQIKRIDEQRKPEAGAGQLSAEELAAARAAAEARGNG